MTVTNKAAELEVAVHAALADFDIFLVRNDKIVRALLTALRTPSEPMVEAMARSVTGYPHKQVLAATFTAAIDSILEQGDGE